MKARLFPAFVIAASLALIFLNAARAEDPINTIKFSEPSKPGTLKIRVGHGDVRVTGIKSDTGEITIKSDAQAVTSAPRKDGLRVITASSSFALFEKANVITLDATENWAQGRGGDFTITAPRNTSVIITSAWGGDVTCTDLSGDVEIKGLNGEVKLNNLSGGALVETMNGEIKATILELHEGKPLSFTSMNGEVALNLPADTKANVRLRTQNGSILTDFDDKVLITKTEAAASTLRTGKRVTVVHKSGDRVSTDKTTNDEIRAAIKEGVQAGAEAAREVAQAIREAAQAAREGVQAAREAEAAANANPTPAMNTGSLSPMPPLPPLPPMTGGKIVSGTLNGGGPDIRIATMNGDVTLRKIKAQ
jgi:urease beta subunit